MEQVRKACRSWLDQARQKLAKGSLAETDLDELGHLLDERSEPADTNSQPRRQRLLYLHASLPAMHGKVIGMALHEPVQGGRELGGNRDQWPYETVHDAVVDGWQIIHFPQQLGPIDDREVDMVGFEFVCQKWSDGHVDQ